MNVGTDHDTAAFAVESIRRWWDAALQEPLPGRPPAAGHLRRGLAPTATAPGWWRRDWPCLAAQAGLTITVLPLPARHLQVEQDRAPPVFPDHPVPWRGRPLTSHQVILSTIAATTTSNRAEGHRRPGRPALPRSAPQVGAEQAKDLEERFITRHGFHGTWNYTIKPVPRAPATAARPRPAARFPRDLDALADPATHRHLPRRPRRPDRRAQDSLGQPHANSGSAPGPVVAPAYARNPAPPPRSSSAWTAYLLAAVCRYRLGN